MSGARTALFVSLAVNLLLVGSIGGVALSEMRHQKVQATQAIARAPNMRVLMESLPPERAAEVRQKVIGAWSDARAERVEAREARQDVAKIAGADAYDAAAVKAAFARMRAADGRLAARFQDVVADAMGTLTVEERRALLRRLVERRIEQGRRGLRARRAGEAAPAAPEEPAP